ncbi:MAG: aldo/keto reductase [Bacteroidetes bacterium]|nr:aldo/keto reductase [Bacteroidota bacterium]
MQKRKLGNTDITTLPLAFGGNVFGWTINEKISFELLDQYVASGFTLIDTADVYSRWASGIGGESETIIGNWMKLRKNRNKVNIATKVGMDMGQGKIDISKKYILKAVEDSLKRLQTDRIDLYQSHKDDETTPVEETLDAYAQLVKEGKIRWIGASNFTPARLKDSLAASKKYNLPRYETLQPIYNLYNREEFEKELLAICVEHNIGVINYYALAAGFLTGKYRSENDISKSVRGAGAHRYMNERGFKILKAMDEVAAEKKTSLAAISVAWLIAQPGVTAPIASATNAEQLQIILKATELSLDSTTIAFLNLASAWK